MENKKLFVIISLFMILLCCVNGISAVSDDVVDDVISEVDSGDESISVINEEQVISVDNSSALVAQENNNDELVNSVDCDSALAAQENNDEVLGQSQELLGLSLDDVEIIGDSKVTPELSVNVNNATVFENATITVTSTNCEGNVTVKVGDNIYENVVIGEEFTLPLLPIGIYDVTVTYAADDIYTEAVNDTEKLEISKADAVISYTRDGNKFTFTVSNDNAIPTGRINVQLGDNYPMTLRLNNGAVTRDFGTSYDSGTYVLNVTYRGDDNFKKSNLVDTIDIIKHNVTIDYNYNNTLFNFNVTSDEGVPTGGITVTFEGPLSVSQFVSLTDGTASYDFASSLARGTYNLTIKYNGASNFEKGELKDTVAVESDVLAPTITTNPAEVRKLLYQSINYKIIVSGGEGNPVPTGTLYYDDDGNDKSAKLNSEGVASINWNNWYDGGIGTTQKYFTYSGDSNYVSISFVVPLIIDPNLSINVALSGRNATFSFDDNSYCYQGTIYVVENGNVLGTVVGDGGSFPRFTLNDLELGKHNFQFLWDYNNLGQNYTYTKAVSIKEGNTTSQWAVPGFDNQNSGNSNYTRFDNGYIAWDAELNNPYESVIIDSDGYIYISDFNNIKIFDDDGTLVNTVDSGTWGALSLIDDEYLIYVRPWTNIVAWDISTFAGVDTTSDFNNIMYTNSRYPVVKGPNGRYYLSVYFNNGGSPNNGKYVTTLNHDRLSNQITYGNVIINSQPISRVVFDNENIYWVNTVDGVRAVDSTSDSVIFSSPDMGTVGVPVVDENNIAYVFGKENTIYALNAVGIVWNVTVNNGIGSVMAVDNDNGLLYAVSADGTLCSYDTNNQGESTEIYNIGANATGIIVDGNYNVYVGDSKGVVWAFNNEGALLWNVSLGAPVTTQLAMDKNGVIYAVTANKLFALGFRNETDLIFEVDENFTTLDNITFTANINSTIVDENIIFTVMGIDNDYKNSYNATIDGGVATWDIGNLPSGNYTVTASYAGNTYYTEASISQDFKVSKVTPELSVNVNNATVFENATITVTSSNCEGNVTVKVGDDYTYENVVIGEEFTLPLLPIGVYDVVVTYAEDANYTDAVNDTEKLEIAKEEPMVEPYVSDDGSEVILSFGGKESGNVFLDVAGVGYYAIIEDGEATFNIDALEPGNHTATVSYPGDENYKNTTFDITIKVPELLNPELGVNVKDTTITVSLNENATGTVIVTVGDISFVMDADKLETIDVADYLAPGKYDVYVEYFGDENFTDATAENSVTVPEVEPLDPKLDVSVDGTVVTVSLNENATGYVVVSADGKDLFFEYDGEPVVVDFSDLEPGNYTVDVTYSGDDVFASANTTAKLTVPEVELLDSELKVDIQNTTVSVSINENATGDVIITVGDISFIQDADELAPIDVSEYLTNGTYPVTVKYLGDDVFAEKVLIGGKVTVPEDPVVEPKDPNLKASAVNSTITVTVDKDATGNVLVDVDGQGYYAEIKDGKAVIDVIGLDAGTYSAVVYYAGDDVFGAANATVSVIVPDEPVVEPKDPNLKASAVNNTITVTVDKDATGSVLVDVDGQGYYAEIKDGKAVIDVIGLDAGTYSAVVYYAGDDVFGAANATVSVIVPEEPVVEPKDPNLKASAVNSTITVTVDKDATGNVLVDVDGQGYYATINDGKAVIEVIGLDEGKYNAVVSYVGDDTFKAANAAVSITVPKKEDPQPEPVDPKADIKVSNETVSVDLPKDATGYLLVDVDGQGYYAPVKDGKATLDLPELALGNHTVTVTYTGDKKYDSANATQTITVEEDIHTVVAENLTKVEKAPDRFEALFTDAKGNPLANTDVTFELNGQKYTRTTDANGKAGMAINLIAGNYTIVTSNPVTGESVTNTITVLPRLEGSDLTKYFRNASQYRVKVYDDNGNPVKAGEIVTFNINGVFYNRTTGNDGFVQLSINLIPGDYIITAQYKGCQIANNIKVLPILSAKDLTKKYGVPGAFETKLVDGQGKAYANQAITFNINGVLYTRNTNSGGIAKLNINLMPGQYIITSVYGNAAISNTVTVTA